MNTQAILDRMPVLKQAAYRDASLPPKKKHHMLEAIDDTTILVQAFVGLHGHITDTDPTVDGITADVERIMHESSSARACFVCRNDHTHTVCDASPTKCQPSWRLDMLNQDTAHQEANHGEK